MSFTTNIKEEIARIPNSKSESISELAGFLRNNGEYTIDSIDLITENATVAKRIYQLMKGIYDISCEIENRKGMNFSKNNLYLIMINDKVEFILKDLSIIDENEQYNFTLQRKRIYLNGDLKVICELPAEHSPTQESITTSFTLVVREQEA